MDEGRAIAFEVLDKGVPIYASDGGQVGTVAGVLAAEKQDIFHGLLVATEDRGLRFLEAAQIASLHERGVDLSIDSAAAAQLPEPQHAALVYDAEDPAVAKGWHHWLRVIERRGDWNRER